MAVTDSVEMKGLEGQKPICILVLMSVILNHSISEELLTKDINALYTIRHVLIACVLTFLMLCNLTLSNIKI